MTLEIGDKAPDFNMPTDSNGDITLSQLIGKPFVLYFYPKDNTPGCTTQACDFSNAMASFNAVDVSIIGVSKDSIKSHAKFREKKSITFLLASDENGDVCERYGVWKEKKMYGKTFMGIERTTFLVNAEGEIANIWRKVKVKDHIQDVKQAVENL